MTRCGAWAIAGLLLIAGSVGGCGGDPDKRSVTAQHQCLSGGAVMTVLATRPGVALPTGASIASGPVCDNGWAFASVGAPDLEDVFAVLRYSAQHWELLTYGSEPCADSQVRQAPAKVRTAAGC
jgi:hypothetical protein